MVVALPFKLKKTTLRVVDGLAFGRDKGGLLVNSRHEEPYWSGTLETPVLGPDDLKVALAFLDDCVDMNRRLDVIHPRYRYPLGYDATSWPMVGDADLGSVTDLRHIVVSGLTTGVVLRASTRLCIIQSGSICYRKITTDVVVSSSIAQTLNIGPRLPPGVFAPGATVRFVNPFLRSMVAPGSWEPDEDIAPTAITFEVSETLR